MENEYVIKGIFNIKLSAKFIIAFLLVILIPTFLIAYLSTEIIESSLTESARKTIETSMKVFWINYNIRAEQMRYGMLQASTDEQFKKAIFRKDRRYLKRLMGTWKEKRPYVDIWIILDPEGRVISRVNSDNYGDTFDINGLIYKAIKEKESIISTEIVTDELLVKEDTSFVEQVRVPIDYTSGDRNFDPNRKFIDDGLIVAVTTPVIGRNNEVIGIIFTGDILSKDYYLPNTIEKETGSSAAIFHNDVGISTNLKNSDGSTHIGCLLTADILSRLAIGESYYGEVTLAGKKYIGAISPIKNHSERVIGSIFTGIPKGTIVEVQKKNINVVTSVTLLGIILAIGISFILTHKITRPLEVLTNRIKEFSEGNKDTKIFIASPEHTRDEVITLCMAFNNMVKEIKEKGREREQYLVELKAKNLELQTMTERLQATNEELEIALEETQSQREELQSANEELTILNEDLEKNRTELIEVNRRLKEEEEEIKKTADRLQLIYNGIKDYIFLIDADYNIIEVNRSFLEARGLKERDVLGKKCNDVLCNHLACAIDVYCMLKDTYETKAPICKETTGPEGKVFQKYSYPQFNSRGNLINVILYVRDITEQTMLREQLIQSERLSSLGELIAGVAHELNNPLTGVLGFSELLLESEKDERVKDKLTKINNEALRCKKIVQSLLTFARWQRPDKTCVNINELIKSTIDLKSYHLKVDSIEVSLEMDKSLSDTMLDSFQIQQVILNLINNAHQAMKEKGGPGRLTIKSYLRDNKIRVDVTDTGIGIPEENITRIFDPFFTTRKAGEGTGLGLSISYGIVKEHDGNLYVNSRYGEGATFVVELPIVPFKATKLKEEAPIAAVGVGSIIVVDDEEAILNLSKEVLSSLGYRVDTVKDGLAALEKIRVHSYDLIISDIKMPNMDGKRFYEEVRKIKPHLTGRIIFTTGDIISHDTKKFLEGIKNLRLEKPFTLEELKKVIFKQLRQGEK